LSPWEYLREVVGELKKMSWLTSSALRRNVTVIVLTLILLAVLILGVDVGATVLRDLLYD
jgi:preprotein translocase SecE subunit